MRGAARGAALALCLGLAAAPAGADAGSAQGEGRPAPAVPLDRLFELPSGFETKPAETRRGESQADWRDRFTVARADVERAQVELKRSKQELAKLAHESNAWSVAPPVGGASAAANEAPLSFELRQRIKRQEAEVDAAKDRLLELEVQANLAGVPESWRAPADEIP